MNTLAKMFEPSKDRLISNAKKMMEKAQDPWFKQYWQKVYVHLLKQYKKLNQENIMEKEIISLILLGVILVGYLLALKEILEMKKILKSMLRRSKKYMKEVVK